MGNYVACKKYKKKRQSGFINFTSTHLELTAKSYVAIGTGTLFPRLRDVFLRQVQYGIFHSIKNKMLFDAEEEIGPQMQCYFWNNISHVKV